MRDVKEVHTGAAGSIERPDGKPDRRIALYPALPPPQLFKSNQALPDMPANVFRGSASSAGDHEAS
ncbi:hypothetical protein [Phreatobacter stygius]|uniref:Uncharacterized protein n=1 Tax=Phreatobacter stygius TaxID=1940610 RepID=A0A4D7AYD2_9HYPH|nr:hypothetical protein [Phreatobacter stygius]QCI66309.1 hypothetical protein E8M01_20060 [Phreatobacter stygius]